jgi:hypothetical protein
VHKGAQMEKFITRYSQTYILVGELELILRIRLIETLSKYSLEKGYTEWHQVLDTKTTFDPNKPSANFGFWRDVKHEEANLRWLIRALGKNVS